MARGLIGVGIAFAILAVDLERGDLELPANFTKLAAATAIAFWFLGWFETVLWVALVALLIPVVDTWSVFAGPTKHIVEERPEVFTVLSFAFPLPGEHAAANLGLPDLLFFALFLATAARFSLRVAWTWVAMVASFGVTTLLAVWRDDGMPALPMLSLAFLIANADLLWRAFRNRRTEPEGLA